MTKRLGILTGGGDAPGLNAVLRAVVLVAEGHYGWDVIGIRQGFNGLVQKMPPVDLKAENVYDLLDRGGTVLGAANKGSPFMEPLTLPNGEIIYEDVSQEAIRGITHFGLDALVVAGGDGTMAIAHRLVQMGAKMVGVPKTIDNDVGATDVTFGFDTAVNTVTEALQKLRTTAESHHRVMVVEVMGRNAGWIALHSGIAGGADAILIPEIPFDLSVVCEKITQVRASGRMYSLIVVAEGAAPKGGEQQFYIESKNKDDRRLGGIAHDVGAFIADCVEAEVRVTVLGHVQRGGQPTPHDRYLSTLFGIEAVHLVNEEKWGYMVAMCGSEMTHVPMELAIQMKTVDPASSTVRAARDLGVVFG